MGKGMEMGRKEFAHQYTVPRDCTLYLGFLIFGVLGKGQWNEATLSANQCLLANYKNYVFIDSSLKVSL